MKKIIIIASSLFLLTVFISCQSIPANPKNDIPDIIGFSTQDMVGMYGDAGTVLTGQSVTGETGYKKYIYRDEGFEVISKNGEIISVIAIDQEPTE